VSQAATDQPVIEAGDSPLRVAGVAFASRLVVGTGKYATYADHLDASRYRLLPNTAGCYSADDAIRVARLGRELLRDLGSDTADWVKLEVLGDRQTLLPDPVGTLAATERLVADGFTVFVYTSDDPVVARRLKELGAASVMPAGSPIGSGQGILNANNLRICLEYLKDGDPDYPVIVDAGVGTASDVAAAMELGVDGVLLNTAIAQAKDPLRMAAAMRDACTAGRNAFLAGRIPRRLYATASSPDEGRVTRPGS
jgi:thiazole synthase